MLMLSERYLLTPLIIKPTLRGTEKKDQPLQREVNNGLESNNVYIRGRQRG